MSLNDRFDRQYEEEAWEPLILRPHAFSTSRYDDAARLLAGESGRLLEVGCGSGRLAIALAGQFAEIVGIDASETGVAMGKRTLKERYPQYADKVHLQVGEADKTYPFPDDTFDVVVALAVLEHVVDLFTMTREIARVCKPSGSLVLCVPNLAYVKHTLNLILGRLPLTGISTRRMEHWKDHGWDGGHLHYFTRSALRDLLTSFGFRPVAWTGAGRLAKLRRWCPFLVGSLTVKATFTGTGE